MANRIAGITVEIGGDTTKLSTALKNVNTEIKSTQTALNDVNRLLKLDPGNTELLTQKHKLLAQAVSETKEKLAQLKIAAEQANEKLANGEITQQGYGYKRISIETGVALNTIKTYCRRHLKGYTTVKELTEQGICPECGKVLIHISGHRAKKFCSDKCRMPRTGSKTPTASYRFKINHQLIAGGYDLLR